MSSQRSARAWLVWGNRCSNPGCWVHDGIAPQCEFGAGRGCLCRFQKQSKVYRPPATPRLWEPPSPWTPLTPQTPPIPLASCWRERDQILLPWQNTRLVCAPYHCCQLLSINIYSFCYTAFCMCVPFIMEKKITDKMVRAPTCRYPESEFLSRYLCAGLLGIGDFVTGFRA